MHHKLTTSMAMMVRTILSQVVYTDVALDPYNSLGALVDWLGG